MYSDVFTAEQAAEELLRRRQARKALLPFSQYVFPGYIWSAARDITCEYLDAARARKIKRLMVFMPPQYGKSQLVSRHLPVLSLGNEPDLPIILTSYGHELAYDLSKDARRIMFDQPYQALFGKLRPSPVVLDPSSSAVASWRIDRHRGGMRASGIGGAVTGRPAGLLLIDDPVKNRSEARSKSVQTYNYQEYHSTLKSRLDPINGVIVLVMTRWDDNDLAGRLLKEQSDKGQDQWTVLRLPLVAETAKERHRMNEMMGIREVEDELGRNPKDDPLGRQAGEPLDPARHDREACANLLAGPAIVAASIWQQSPRPAEGDLIHRHWFEVVDAYPADAEPVRGWDLAATEAKLASEDPDYTVGLKMVRKDFNNVPMFFIAHMARDRVSALGVEKLIKQTATIDGPTTKIRIEQEPGAHGKLYARTLVGMLQGYSVRVALPSSDKVTRALPWIAQAEAGNIKIVRGPWVEDILQEFERFPDGGHDDIVDAMSICFESLVDRALFKPHNL